MKKKEIQYTAARLLVLLLMMTVGVNGAWGQTTYYQEDYESEATTSGWTTGTSERFTPVLLEENGNHFLSVKQDERNNNGTTVTGTVLTNTANAGTCFKISFDLKISSSTDQSPTSFSIKDAANSNVIFSLTATGTWATTWNINNNENQQVTLPNTNMGQGANSISDVPWYTVLLERFSTTTYLTISDKLSGNTVFSRTEISTTSVSGGLGNMEFVSSRYNANFAIDNIVVYKLGWDVTEHTVTLTDINNDNKITSGLPTLYNPDNESVEFSYDGSVLGNADHSYPPRIKNIGNGTVTATFGSSGSSSYTYHVVADNATVTCSGNTCTFESVGVLAPFYQVTGVPKITMTLGESDGGTPTSVVVNDADVGPVLKAIDGNGYSHPNIDWGRANNTIPARGVNGGTYYVFDPTDDGKLIVTGKFSNPLLYEFDGSSSTPISIQVSGNELRADLENGKHYYLYNGKVNSENNTTPLLHAFTFDTNFQRVTFDGGNGVVSKSLGDAPFTKIATSNKGATISYTSSDPSIASVNANGQVTILHAGIVTITAKAAPINGIPSASSSYQLEINIAKKWVFDNALGANWTTTSWTTTTLNNQEMANVPETAGLLFDNTAKADRLVIFFGQSIQVGFGVKLTIPNLHRGQVVDFMLGSSSSAASATFENVSWLDNREAVGTVENIRGTDVSHKMVVESDGSVTVTGGGNNFLVNAIYVYNLGDATTGEIHYNGDLPMIEGETATPHNIFFYDSHNTPLSNSLFGELYGFTSDNPSLLTVDVNTGKVSVAAGAYNSGTATITCYAKSMDAIKYQDAILTRTITIQSSFEVKTRSKNIHIDDLLYLPMASSANNGLDRTIPSFRLTLTGGNNLMSSSDGSMLTMNGGNIRIEPRYNDGHTENVYITNAVVYFSDGTAQTVNATGNQEYIDLSFHGKEITSIMVKYKCSNYDVDPDNVLNASQIKPSISFPTSSSHIGVGNTIPTIQATSGHKNLRNIHYSISDEDKYYVLLSDDEKTLTGRADGTATLQAQFTGDNVYFIPSNPATHTIYVGAVTGYTASIEISNKLDVEAHCGYDGFAFVNEVLTVQPSIVDADNNPVDLSNYTVTYTTSDINKAYANAQGGITTGNTPGQVTVAATFTPITSGETLSASYQLGVLSGFWDVRTYNQTNGHNQLGENDGWGGTSTGLRRDRDVGDFRFIIRTDNTPLAQTIALKTRNRMRFIYDSRNQVSGGQLHLFGKGVGTNESPNGGGEVCVPVRAGMLIEIFGRTNTLDSRMIISGDLNNNNVAAVTDLAGNDVTEISIGETNASYYYLAKNDGVFYIKNPSTNLDFYIGYIRVTNQMVFEYGEEVYVDINDLNNRQFKNPIVNQGTTTISYDKEIIATSDLCQNLATDGTITFAEGKYGSMRVFATGSGSGSLNGKSGSYVVHSIGMTVADQVDAVVGTNPLTFHPVDQINIVTGAGLSATNLKNKVEFSIVSKTASVSVNMYGATGNQELVITGAGTVVVKAKLGAIERLITYNIAGGQLTSISQVIRKDKPSHTITVEGTGISNVQFDWNRMALNAQGEIKDFMSSLSHNSTGNSLTISGFDQIQKGGAIPIYASYVYGGSTFSLEGMLTVAYSSHIWNFQHDLTYEMNQRGNWSPLNGTWNTTATYEKPDDSDTYRDDTKTWRYVRKIAGHTDVSIVYYYNHTSQGQNATILPSTAGLVINSTKDGKQLGVEMNTNAAHLADFSTGKYVCSNLMILRGGQFIVPKVKPGQWIEVRWTRHKEDMAERFAMKNLLDVEGNYIDEIYKIGNCFYNLDYSTSTYMFQVAGPEDDPSVVLDADGCVDAIFTVDDNIYISIQQIELHDLGWDYNSSMAQQLKCIVDNADAQLIDPHFVCDGNNHTINILSKDHQNAPNAPQRWEISFDGTLQANGATKSDGLMLNSPSFTYRGGWGKVYVTLTSYTQNYKYVANRNTWIITIGAQPQQDYPYTWDFSKYFATTKASVGGSPDDYFSEDPKYTASRNAITETDVTSTYITNPGFEMSEGNGWSMVASNQNLHGGLANNYCAESWHSTFTLSQTLNNLPNGVYRLSAQGFYRQDEGAVCTDFPYFFANDVKQAMPIREGTENSMSDASSSFSDGKYFIKPITVEVTNGTLSIGVANRTSDNIWCIWDNFTLTKLEDNSSTYKFTKSTRAHEYRKDIDTWKENGDNENVITTDYYSRKYWSYYVEGAQLVSRSLGILPETEGLGFGINQKLLGGLTLDMQNTVDGNPVTGNNVEFPYTWRNGKLVITGGGTIIVPKPGDDYDDYYIYIRSNVAPTSVTNAEVNTDVYRNDVNNEINQYRYRFTANADAVVSFSGNAEIYQIGVTNIHKTMNTVGGIGWATESRNHTIDHALTGHLTINDANAYTVRYDSYDMETATVALTHVDEDGYVPATTENSLHGIVLRQDNGAVVGTYSVPLFYPAVTTTVSSTPTVYNSATGNMMYPNLTKAKHYQEEREGCTKFILTNVHWTFSVESSWGKQDDNYIENRTGGWQAHGAPTISDAAGFYRMHIWGNDTDDTMDANTAYLLVPSDKLPIALWKQQGVSQTREGTIGIRGYGDDATDVEELTVSRLEGQKSDNDSWYTLSGMKLSGKPTKAGLYIHKNRKVVIK